MFFLDNYILCVNIVCASGVGCSNRQGINMKKILFASFVSIALVTPAVADGIVTETETVTMVEVVKYNLMHRVMSRLPRLCHVRNRTQSVWRHRR